MATDNPIFTVINKLASTVRCVSEFTESMSRLGESFNTVIAKLNEKVLSDDETRELRRSTKLCRLKYCESVLSSAAIVNRFNQLLEFAELDDSFSSTIVDSVAGGNYVDFSAYINQLKQYLDQCVKLYQDFLDTCTDAESYCQNVGAKFKFWVPNSQQWSADFESQTHLSPAINTQPGVVVGSTRGILGGVVIFIVVKLLGYSFLSALSLGTFAAFAFTIASKKVFSAKADQFHYIKGSFKKVIQDYKLVHSSGLKTSTSFYELQESLTSLSSGNVDDSFKSAFGLLQAEVKKACKIVQPCREKLDKGIILTEIQGY